MDLSKFRTAADAPIATIFFIKEVPNSLAISVNGTTRSVAEQFSGSIGLNLASAKIIPEASSS